MEALHLIAPQAQLIPFDFQKMIISNSMLSDDEAMAYGIEEAIRLKVDVINMSRGFSGKPKTGAACRKAVDNGIAIVFQQEITLQKKKLFHF